MGPAYGSSLPLFLNPGGNGKCSNDGGGIVFIPTSHLRGIYIQLLLDVNEAGHLDVTWESGRIYLFLQTFPLDSFI